VADHRLLVLRFAPLCRWARALVATTRDLVVAASVVLTAARSPLATVQFVQGVGGVIAVVTAADLFVVSCVVGRPTSGAAVDLSCFLCKTNRGQRSGQEAMKKKRFSKTKKFQIKKVQIKKIQIKKFRINMFYIFKKMPRLLPYRFQGATVGASLIRTLIHNYF
jgi:hypothetical protein